MIDAEKKLNAVIGFPLRHTKSPVLHHFIYQKLNINAIFIPIEHNNIFHLIKLIRNFPVSLAAVTMPFKQVVLTYLDEQSAEVEMLKAVNTVINYNGKLCGYNTDVDGIAYAFRKINVKQKKVLILGAGGAASAAGYFFKQNQAELMWFNRSREKALLLQHLFGGEILNSNHLDNFKVDIIVLTDEAVKKIKEQDSQ